MLTCFAMSSTLSLPMPLLSRIFHRFAMTFKKNGQNLSICLFKRAHHFFTELNIQEADIIPSAPVSARQ